MAVHGALMLILTGAGVSLAHDCYTTTSYYNEYYKSEQYSSYPFYCPHGCCGYDPVYCCQDSFVDYYSYADYVSSNVGGVIAGIVIGSLVGLALFIGLIVLICVCCRNANRRSIPGQVITTQGTGAPVTYVNTRKYLYKYCFRVFSVGPYESGQYII
ncbi:uncharacterized protein [Argopecten irradians]|uniref:uncharacterized protein n=1 Tax=Argopecten irradians TaxID=31199 RepID=UPI00371EB71D